MKFDKIISYILIISILVAVVAVIYIIVNPSPSEKFTEFYILGPNGKAGNYSANLTADESGNATIGIVNHESNTTNYQLVGSLENTTILNQSFTLANNEKKEINITYTPNQSGNNQKLEFFLYKLPNNQQPYRYIYLQLNVG